MGLLDNKLRERLLREPDLILENVIKHGQAAEETKQHARELQRRLENEQKSIHALKRNAKPKSKLPNPTKSNFFKNCKFCWGSHTRLEETALLTQGDVNLAMKVVTLPNAVLKILWTW